MSLDDLKRMIAQQDLARDLLDPATKYQKLIDAAQPYQRLFEQLDAAQPYRRLMEQIDAAQPYRRLLEQIDAAQPYRRLVEQMRLSKGDELLRHATLLPAEMADSLLQWKHFLNHSTVIERHLALDAEAYAHMKGAAQLFDSAAQFDALRNDWAESQFEALDRLTLEPGIEIDDPTVEDVELVEARLLEELRDEDSRIVQVHSLPFQVVAAILREPERIRNLSPREFEEFIAELVSQLGYRDVILTPRSRDGGKDIIASYDAGGIPLSFYFECKHYSKGKVEVETVRALLGVVMNDRVNKGVIVTSSTFTAGARRLLVGNAMLDGRDYDGLLGWIAHVKGRRGLGSGE